MEPYSVNMMSGASMFAHIARLHTSIQTHAQDTFFEFHIFTVCAHRLLQSLPAVHL